MTDAQVRGLASDLVTETMIPMLAEVMCVVDNRIFVMAHAGHDPSLTPVDT
jgi:hypothetical protein